MSKLSDCLSCGHEDHFGHQCNAPIRNDIYASEDPQGLGPARIFVRSILVDMCRCRYMEKVWNA